MRVSLEWLSEYVSIEVSPEELADLLSMSGTVVDRILSTGAGVSGVVVGRVVEVSPHPGADNLSIAMVEDGSMVREIVCGAPNVHAGMKSGLALPGARLPAVSDKELKRAKIRGVESDGMLVSSAELGVSEDAAGILELDDDAPVGADIHEVMPLEDVILDLEITPNRPDCMSMVGIAREVAALTGTALRLPEVALTETGAPIEDCIKVIIKDPEGCPRYTARAVLGVRVCPSPNWMQRRLVASGVRPISNLVDVTNYVLMELGQPLHAFDLDLIGDSTIIVRLARMGEVLITLDGAERQLDDHSLVIADISRPVALAGIMGGEGSEVMDSTKNVLIESAYFDPTSIMMTSRRLGLRTEASARFERGTDPEGTAFAARRAAALIRDLAGGEMAAGEVDEFPGRREAPSIILRPSRVNEILGTSIPRSEMVEILESLEAPVSEGDTLTVTVPTFRPDLEREIDLVEEVARIYGYGRIPESLPGGGGIEAGLTHGQVTRARIVDALIAQGLMEAWTLSFMRRGDLDSLMVGEDHPLHNAVELQNPLSETGELMRTTLLPGLLRSVAGNVNRGNRDLALFEAGRVFTSNGPHELPIEIDSLGVVLYGRAGVTGWAIEDRDVDFFDSKGIVENVLEAAGVENAEFKAGVRPFTVKGRTAELLVGDSPVGFIGQLHSGVVSSFGLEGDVYAAELSIDALLDAAVERNEYAAVSRFPAVLIDIALILPDEVECSEVECEIVENGGSYLRSVKLFDLYKGPQIPEGMKSLAFSLEFNSGERTLTDEETHLEIDRIVKALESRFGAKLRDR